MRIALEAQDYATGRCDPLTPSKTGENLLLERGGMLPRTIWCLWFQGWADAPDLVRACAASWRRHNPDWNLQLLSGDTLAASLDPLPRPATASGNLPLEARSGLATAALTSADLGVPARRGPAAPHAAALAGR